MDGIAKFFYENWKTLFDGVLGLIVVGIAGFLLSKFWRWLFAKKEQPKPELVLQTTSGPLAPAASAIDGGTVLQTINYYPPAPESPKPEEHESWLYWYNEKKKVQDELDALVAGPQPPDTQLTEPRIVRLMTLREMHQANEKDRKIERKKQDLRLIEERLAVLSGDRSELIMHVADPRIYIEICGPEPGEGFFSGTAFILRNDGGDVGHNVSLQPLVLTTGQVHFPRVAILPAHNNNSVRISASVENVSVLQSHDIKAALRKEWNAAGKLTSEFCQKMRITYGDFRKREFETSFDLIYHPILDIGREGRRYEAIDKLKPVLTVRNVQFKRLS